MSFKNLTKKSIIISLLTLFMFVTASPVFAAGVSPSAAEQNAFKAVDYLHDYLSSEGVDGLMGWRAAALYGMGEDLQSSKWKGNEFREFLKEVIKSNKGFNPNTTTDIARMIITLKAAGLDPANCAGVNLVSGLEESQLPSGQFPDDLEYGGEELINAHIWAMIALKAAGSSNWDTDAAVTRLEKLQNNDGGFNFMAGCAESDVDVTASALVALALSGEKSGDSSVSRALQFLQGKQLENGGFTGWYTENAESTSWVIQALAALGINPQSPPWMQGNAGPVDALLEYQLADGSFTHIKGGKSNLMATENALLALGDYINNQSVFQRMTDSSLKAGNKGNKTGFSDIRSDYWNYDAINKLAKAGVMNGYPDGTFRPEKSITRAFPGY